MKLRCAAIVMAMPLVLGGCVQSRTPQAPASASCSLSAADLEERKALLKQLTRGVVERKQIPEGLAYRFNASDRPIPRLARLLELESDCCQFLTFKIIAERNQGPVWLEVTGPREAQSRIREYFDGNQ